MPSGWEWDESLYRGSAPFYMRGRAPYAPGLADALANLLALGGRDRLLDVGCGPGVLTLLLAPFVAEAIGVDPDPGMLAEAARRADAIGIGNARWLRARGEDLPGGLGQFRLATFGQSFHWMDRPRVAAAALGLLEPGGAFVLVADVKGSSGPLAAVAPPGAAVRRDQGSGPGLAGTGAAGGAGSAAPRNAGRRGNGAGRGRDHRPGAAGAAGGRATDPGGRRRRGLGLVALRLRAAPVRRPPRCLRGRVAPGPPRRLARRGVRGMASGYRPAGLAKTRTCIPGPSPGGASVTRGVSEPCRSAAASERLDGSRRGSQPSLLGPAGHPDRARPSSCAPTSHPSTRSG